MSWAQFLKLHWDVLVATDFFTVEVATWHGLVTYYVLVAMELATRRVQIERYLIHDRDTKYTQAFDALVKASGVEPIRLPARSPNLNAHCERFVRSIKEEALAQMVILGERFLYYTLQEYLAHYHHERNHQGLTDELIIPEPDLGSHSGQVRRRERRGGLLSYYHREAA